MKWGVQNDVAVNVAKSKWSSPLIPMKCRSFWAYDFRRSAVDSTWTIPVCCLLDLSMCLHTVEFRRLSGSATPNHSHLHRLHKSGVLSDQQSDEIAVGNNLFRLVKVQELSTEKNACRVWKVPAPSSLSKLTVSGYPEPTQSADMQGSSKHRAVNMSFAKCFPTTTGPLGNTQERIRRLVNSPTKTAISGLKRSSDRDVRIPP